MLCYAIFKSAYARTTQSDTALAVRDWQMRLLTGKTVPRNHRAGQSATFVSATLGVAIPDRDSLSRTGETGLDRSGRGRACCARGVGSGRACCARGAGSGRAYCPGHSIGKPPTQSFEFCRYAG